MSHCTKFDFTYSDEETIVKSFKKMGIRPSTELVSEYASDVEKKLLSKFGYMGKKQMRAICGCKDGINMFMCKLDENHYELICEHPDITQGIETQMNELAKEYKQAYIEVAAESVIKKIENSGTPAQLNKQNGKFTINFGPALEYQIVISYDEQQITEDVFGVKGSLCTKLTEDIENILSSPETELVSTIKPEMDMVVDNQVLQVVSLEL